MYSDCHEILKGENGEAKRAAYLQEWAKGKFGLTASVDKAFDNRDVNMENTPVKIRFTDVGREEEAIKEDQQNLLKFCAIHDCSEFCMRKNKGQKYVTGEMCCCVILVGTTFFVHPAHYMFLTPRCSNQVQQARM